MKKKDVDELFEETYSTYNSKIHDKVSEVESIIMEIKDANSKYGILKNKIIAMYTDDNFDDSDSVELYELFSGILRDINRLHTDLFNLIEKEIK